MSANKKEHRRYVFTVEGETEKWYFEWLEEQINSCEKSAFDVSIRAIVEQSPYKYSKKVNPISTPKVTHVCDYESNDSEHVKKFKNILSELHDANSNFGRKFEYALAYSNFTFDLWIILHKERCNAALTSRLKYLPLINKAYNEKFISLNQYKEESNFKRCLRKLNLENVLSAIECSKNIMHEKEKNLEHIEEYKGFKYYKNNPALTIWKPIEAILKECKLL